MLGISLYGYPYLKLVKMLYLSYYWLCLLFNKIPGSAWKRGGEGRGRGQRGEMVQTMYTHMNK
jgi:hypothetical protein